MNYQWSKKDKEIAKQAFSTAYDRECMSLADQINNSKIKNPEELWELQDLLWQKRKEIDQKYDYRYSVLVLVFARLVREGNLRLDELAGMSQEMIKRIKLVAEL